jgi:hypothetical protein
MPRDGNLLVNNDWTDNNTIKVNRTVDQTILGLQWLGPRFGAHLNLWLSTETVDDSNLPPSQDPRNTPEPMRFGSGIFPEY